MTSTEDYLNEWIQRGTLPSHNITDATDPRLGNYNFHPKVECTVNEYLHNYWKNDPQELPQHKEQLEQTYYHLLVLQTRQWTIEQLTMYLQSHRRKGQWFMRRAYDQIYQLKGHALQHGKTDITYGEIQETQVLYHYVRVQMTKNKPYGSKTEIKKEHFVDHGID
eukprot:807473-Amphidinium_carterae.2